MAAPVAMPPPAVVPQPSVPLAFAKDAPENILTAKCGSCHGPAAPVAASGGIRFINDIDQLVAAGLIVPLSSATSRIIRVMADGSMPPPGTGLSVTQADLDIVAQYIDNPLFWPGVGTPTPLLDAGVETPVADAGADGG